MPIRPPVFRPPGRLSAADERRDYDRQRLAQSETRRLYKTARWVRLREQHLIGEPLCRMCLARGILNDGSLHSDGAPQEDRRRVFLVCDHVTPHRGDVARFWAGPFQTLCPDDHDRSKQVEELAR